MKRPLFIIIGIILIFILSAIWIYVLFFGSPENADDQFADLSLGDTTDTTAILGDPGEADGEPFVNMTGPERLRQLTTKRVIGYETVQLNASSTPTIYFAEAGTGHVFSIDLETGEEARVSATTIPNATMADITADGAYIMLRSNYVPQREHLIGLFSTSTETLSARVVDADIIDFTSTADNTFLFAIQSQNSVEVREYFPISDTSDVLFTIPYREAAISWANTARGPHYVYPKPSSHLKGFAYKVVDGFLERIQADGLGFSITGNTEYALFSNRIDEDYFTYVYNDQTKSTEAFDSQIIPEKCTFFASNSTQVLCARELTGYTDTTLDLWYRGAVSFNDSLWEIDLDGGGGPAYLIDLGTESGREIDVINGSLNASEERLFFQNKNDYTLWLYELSTPEQ